MGSMKEIFNSLLLKELLKGLSVTGRHAFARKITVQYPEEKTPQSFRFRGLHALRQRLVVAATEQRVEPDQPVARTLQPRDLVAEQLRIAAIPAIADQQHHRPAPEHTPAPMVIEIFHNVIINRNYYNIIVYFVNKLLMSSIMF